MAALAALRHAALRECGETGGGRLSEPAAAAAYRLAWHGAMSAPDLAGQALQVAAELTSRRDPVRRGRVYCYGCAAADCAHSAPADPGHVFSGYQSTGRPQWDELFNVLLQLSDARTDQLFAPKARVLARVIDRRFLIGNQLASFGRNSLTYRIWGQVVAGYFRLGGVRTAMTVQWVESWDHRLRVQVLADSRLQRALTDDPENRRSAFHRVHDALEEARRQTESLSKRWQATRDKRVRREVRQAAVRAQRHLAQSIEKKGRQQQRRTVHAEVRARQQRPVAKAREDLSQAMPGSMFRDTVKQSVIILGKGGRMHAFSDDGRHITSMILKGDEFERRRRRRRYLPLETEACDRFRSLAMAALAMQHGTETATAANTAPTSGAAP